MKRNLKFLALLLLSGAPLFVSCNDDDNNDPPAEASIYDRLGGEAMVQDPDAANGVMIESGRLAYRKVVGRTVQLIVADIQAGAQGNLAEHFAPLLAEVGAGNTTNLAVLQDNLVDFFSFNTGGTNPVNTYSGLDMVAAHNPAQNPRMGTTSSNADYDKFVGYVGAAAIENGVPANSDLFNDVVAVLESLRDPIVQE
ncbi:MULTISPECIES: hypothetical protein [Flavobacterium]|uniref:Group 1 truncated hemoglobin n=1 Tax=Flavobacterium aurantiibacter TaxID=2023067 RepID=A0A255ZYA3_9FLAO|nr:MULTISPECIES: hypothetical protein [Flavobacterium]OYQ46473.1 hypothetical protein CHX27_04340 [Flavobacterium aurantiibacter]